jgi:hypothetical protein
LHLDEVVRVERSVSTWTNVEKLRRRALLERWRADETRLDEEVEAVRTDLERINDEVDRRPDGQEAKTVVRATPTGRIPSQPAPATPRAAPGARQRPPTPTIS